MVPRGKVRGGQGRGDWYGASMASLRRLIVSACDGASALLERTGLRLLRSQRGRAVSVRLTQDLWREIESERYAGAIFLAKAAVAADPTWGEGHRALALANLRKGNVAQARAAYQAGIGAAPDDPLLPAALGDLEWEQGQFVQAEAAYRRALEREPPPGETPKFLLNLAWAVCEQGRLDEAESLLREARERAPEDTGLLLTLGHVELRQGRYAQAERTFRTTITRDPASAHAHYGLGYALAGRRSWREALTEVRGVVERAPDNAEYHRFLSGLERQMEGADRPN